MTIGRELRFWLVGIAVFFLVLYLFRSVLLPFVAGMAVAYFLAPVCDRLETYKLSRTLAVSIVSLVFALLVIAVLLLLLPLIVNQVVAAATKVQISSFYIGGTSLLIVVGVALDTVQQMQAHMVMRHYSGFNK